MMGDGGMHLVNGPGYFQHDGRQMDDGDSANCRIAERPYNPQASAESPTRAAQDHARYHALHEYAQIYHALAAREAKGSERKLILLCLAEEADVRVERVEMSLQKFRIAHTLPAETWFRRLIRWFLLRWRVSWTLAVLDRMESRRSYATLGALTQLNRLCRVIAASRVRPNQFFSRLSSYHSDDP